MLALLCMARERGCRLSELTNDLPHRFTASDRLQNFAIEVSHALIARLSADWAYIDDLMAPDSGEVMNVDTTDGLRVTFANGDIVHLRPSGNAPELRCYAEADTQERAQDRCNACLQRVLSSHAVIVSEAIQGVAAK